MCFKDNLLRSKAVIIFHLFFEESGSLGLRDLFRLQEALVHSGKTAVPPKAQHLISS